MSTNVLPLVIDVILVACLFIGVMFGGKKGLIKGVIGVVVLIVGLVAAGLVAKALTPSVSAWLEPKVETRMIQKLIKEMSAADYTVMDSLKDRLEELNIGTEFLDKLEDSVGNVAKGAIRSAVSNLAETVSYVVLFGFTFAVVSLLLGVLVKALDIFSKLPVVNLANHLGGAALGLLKSALIIYVVVWFMYHLRIVLTKDIVESSTVLKFFATVNPLDLLLKNLPAIKQ